MYSSLLTTKLRIPPKRSVVQRARLIDTLKQGVSTHPLTLLLAPAGYGKTTLLAEWAHSSDLPVAWFSVSEEDNDLNQFLRYVISAWAEIQPRIMESAAGLLLSDMFPDSKAVLAGFINDASTVSDHTVFVIDDYHLIEESSVHEAMTFLIDHLPPTVHFVLAGRNEPALPLARYRARNHVMELRVQDLHFSLEETSDFLNQLMQLDLSVDQLAALHTKLEGWITGLQLVALTRKQNLSDDDWLVSGRHRFIVDYLSDDVLAQVPESTRRFLLQTSILDRLCGSLCDAVTEGEDGQALLESLERANLFLMPLDARREWFRYHSLFADCLRDELHRRYLDEVDDLHRRACRWYLAHQMPDPAFRHGLAAKDIDLVAHIVDLYGNAKLMAGELRLVKSWLDALPADWYSIYPVLGLAEAGLLAFSGEFEACIQCIDKVEQRLASIKSEAREWQLARVTAIRCLVACTQNNVIQAETFAAQALQALPEDERGFRPGIYVALGDTYRQSGRWEKAKACYLKALKAADSPSVRVAAVHVFGALADLALRRGSLREAAAYWRKALTAIEDRGNWGRLSLPVTGWVHIRIGEILYEWNELPEAWDHISGGLERAELGGDVRALIAGYLIAGRVKLAEGDTAAAAAYLERARPLVESAEFSDWASAFEGFQLDVWLAQNRLPVAINRADEILQNGVLDQRLESEVVELAAARVLILKGEMPLLDQALQRLNPLLQSAVSEGRMGAAVEMLALQALAHWKRGASAEALTALERALRLAEPEGYVRIFIDLALPMARLLQEARSRNVMPAYVDELLAACGAYLTAADQHTLPEPLTSREQEILELLAAGLTNSEIAEMLVIASETVKKHASTIYGKLDVSNRTEAAARARELGLLS